MDTAQLWSEALSLDDYVGQMWRKNRKAFTRNRERITIDAATRDHFAAQPISILVLTEHYCEDSLQLVPVIWRLADEVEQVDVRILRQHQHPELASRYLVAGHPAIPVLILLNSEGHELGALVERPARMTQEITAEIQRFQRAHPDLPGIRRSLDHMPESTRDAVKQHITTWRDDQLVRWAVYVLEDLTAIAANVKRH